MLPRPAKSVQNGTTSVEKLEHTVPAEKESDLGATEKAVGNYTRAAFAKRRRNRAVCPEYQIMRGERVKVGKNCTLARERGIKARAWRGKSGLHSEGRASKKSLPRRSRRRYERVSGHKSSPG